MKIKLLCLIILVFPCILNAQKVIEWKTNQISLNETKVGDTLNLVFEAKLFADYYMYATGFVCEMGPIPVSLVLDSEVFELVDSLKSKASHAKHDQDWDCTINVFKKTVSLNQKVKIKSVKNSDFTISYQTCKKDFNCILGKHKGSIAFASDSDQAQIVPPPVEEKPCTPLENVVKTSQKGLLLFVLLAFLSGIITVFMPCIFPLMPMTVSYFSKSSNSKTENYQKIIFYGLCIVGIYTALAILPSFFLGSDRINNWLSTHWIPNSIFFLVFMIFGFSFLGAFEIRLPSKWANNADKMADKGGYLGLFFMALTLIIVSFSCTGPFLSSILILSSKGGMGLKPILGMLAYSLGFALPFVFLAIMPSFLQKLPKSGNWMNVLKLVFGILEIGLAMKFFSTMDLAYGWGFLSRELFLIIWVVLAVVLSFYLFGLIKLSFDKAENDSRISFSRFVLASFSLGFAIYCFLGVLGRPVLALSGILPPVVSQNVGNFLCQEPIYSDKFHSPKGINGYFDLEQAKKCAIANNKPLLIDFTGHGCANCRKMEDNVLVDKDVIDEVGKHFIFTSLFVDDKTMLPPKEWVKDSNGDFIKELGEKNLFFENEMFCEVSQPMYAIINPKTNEVIAKIGYTELDGFINFLQKHHYKQ